jgi:Collagenase and related proteases
VLRGGEIEILAPAKNRDIGIAAVDCGADALYIAGPSFGAREAAGNSIEDIELLAKYAHRYGVRVYMVINTILYDSEIDAAVRLANRAYDIGCDALIVQDLGLINAGLPPMPIFASTQTDIRSVEQAKALEALGFSRLILARELSLKQISEIRSAVNIELESFVHGALCVSYSGQCYMSFRVTGRSGNRGECSQMCRSEYNLIDSSGSYLVKNRALLSLKDLNLSGYIGGLIEAGVTSFKIEGRLKNASYVKNIVRYYRSVVDNYLVDRNYTIDKSCLTDENDLTETCYQAKENYSAERMKYKKSSFGTLYGGFSPNPDYTFSRGYTTFNIEGIRGDWCSGESTTSIGEYVGIVENLGADSIGNTTFTCIATPGINLNNGDGLLFIPSEKRETAKRRGGNLQKKEINGNFCGGEDVKKDFEGRKSIGARANVVEEDKGVCRISLNESLLISKGDKILRNYNRVFEKELENNMPIRYIEVKLNVVTTRSNITVMAECENGCLEQVSLSDDFERARDIVGVRATIKKQLGKSSGIYLFKVVGIDGDEAPFLPLSKLNEIRRELALRFDSTSPIRRETKENEENGGSRGMENDGARTQGRPAIGDKAVLMGGLKFDYRANIANRKAKEFYDKLFDGKSEWGFEIASSQEAELMRCKYCIKFELGFCDKLSAGKQRGYVDGKKDAKEFREPLWLENGKMRFRLEFDCKRCEMIIFG